MSDQTTRHHGLPRPALAALIAALLFGVGVVAFNAPALARTRMDASVQGRTMVGNRAAGNHGALDGSQRVRAFPLCSPDDVLSAQTAPGAPSGEKICEDPAHGRTSPDARITKGTMTP
jgi:hypothetical protein